MISSLNKYLLASMLMAPILSFSQMIESGFEFDRGISFVNSKKDNIRPVIEGNDISYNDIFYYPSTWEFKNPNSVGAFIQFNDPSSRLLIGAKLRVGFMDLNMSGITDYSDEFYSETYGDYDSYNASQGGNASIEQYTEYINSKRINHQHEFNYTGKRFEYSFPEFTVGMVSKPHKSLRRYFLFSIGLLGKGIINEKISFKDDFRVPNFISSTIVDPSDFSCGFGVSYGLMWRRFRLYAQLNTTLTKERIEKLDRDLLSLPYTRYAHLSLGLGFRFQGPKIKPVITGQYNSQNSPKRLEELPRMQNKWSLGLQTTVNVAFADYDYRDQDIHLMSREVTEEPFGNSTRERIRIDVSQFEGIIGISSGAQTQLGAYFEILSKNGLGLRIESGVAFGNFKIGYESDEVEILETTPGYYNVNSSSRISSEGSFQFTEYQIPSTIELCYIKPEHKSIAQGEKVRYGFLFGLTHSLHYVSARNFSANGDKQTIIMNDFHGLMMGNYTENNPNHYISESYDGYLFDSELEVLATTPEELDFNTFAESPYNQLPSYSTSYAVSLGMLFKHRRFNFKAALGLRISNDGRMFYKKGPINIGVQYMLFGK